MDKLDSRHLTLVAIRQVCLDSIYVVFISARRLWKDYFTGVDAVIYLVDVNDRKRFGESCKELNVRDMLLLCFQRPSSNALLCFL